LGQSGGGDEQRAENGSEFHGLCPRPTRIAPVHGAVFAACSGKPTPISSLEQVNGF